jgi:hypothetical protein
VRKQEAPEGWVAVQGGKLHPTYTFVRQEAEKHGLVSLECKVVQYPSAENGQLAVVEATATFPGPDGRERVFTEIGDCDNSNCNARIAPHKVRMAATRAKGRAMRDALCITEALVEELYGEEEAPTRAVQPPHVASGADRAPQGVVGKPAAHTLRREGIRHVRDKSQLDPDATCSECPDYLTEIEAQACREKGWPNVCFTCSKKRVAA